LKTFNLFANKCINENFFVVDMIGEEDPYCDKNLIIYDNPVKITAYEPEIIGLTGMSTTVKMTIS